MIEQFIITFQILIIDVVMAADNAIIIGIIAANFAPENRRKIIAWGVAAAFLFRIFFALGATIILEYARLKIAGGVMLLRVVNNLSSKGAVFVKELDQIPEGAVLFLVLMVYHKRLKILLV